MTTLPTPWRKPSGITGHGPELRLCGDGHVEIRNSGCIADGDGQEWFAAFSRKKFAALCAAIRAGEYDDLAAPESVIHYRHPPLCGSDLSDGSTWSGNSLAVTCPPCRAAREIAERAEEIHAEHHPGCFVPSLDSCAEHARAEYEAMAAGLIGGEQ